MKPAVFALLALMTVPLGVSALPGLTEGITEPYLAHVAYFVGSEREGPFDATVTCGGTAPLKTTCGHLILMSQLRSLGVGACGIRVNGEDRWCYLGTLVVAAYGMDARGPVDIQYVCDLLAGAPVANTPCYFTSSGRLGVPVGGATIYCGSYTYQQADRGIPLINFPDVVPLQDQGGGRDYFVSAGEWKCEATGA